MERIRELLDEAVAGIEPRTADPVAAVARRRQVARRNRVVVAAALAVALVGGGFVVSHRPAHTVPPAPAAEDITAQPPRLYVDGDEVVAGSIRLPIPAGWRVIRPERGKSCGRQDRTIVLGDLDSQENCIGEIELRPTSSRQPYGLVAQLSSPATDNSEVLSPPVSYTVRGGEPAWLTFSFDDESMQPGHPKGYSYFNIVVFPWSLVTMTVRADGAGLRKLLESLRSEPAASIPLVLPRTAADASLTLAGGSPLYEPPGFARTKDPATIAAVLKLLRRQSAVVDNARACARDDQPGVRLTFSPIDLDTLRPTAERVRTQAQRKALMALSRATAQKGTTVVIPLGDSCQEAVSSFGGRVRITDATLKELKRLFGIGAR
jgi:hypothetical protein